MDLDRFRASVSRRYKVPIQRALFAQTASKDPIAISQVVSPPVQTEVIPPEPAFSIHVHMVPLPGLDVWIDGRHAEMPPLNAGDIVLFNLDASPFAHIHHPMDFLRIQISQRTLDDLAYDRGGRRVGGLRTILGGAQDQVLHGLSCALLARLDTYGPDDSLFVDHVALAFHVHIVQAYGHTRSAAPRRGGLAPWQLQRACEMMVAKLTGAVTVAELAGGLRGFRELFRPCLPANGRGPAP